MSATSALHTPVYPFRAVTAGSLFDGHDAAINIMRRLLQAQGAEVIHLGHDRGVEQVVTAAVQEDANAVYVSSYQGGHVEYFTYLVERLRERGAGHVNVYGGGGGVIVAEEIELLHARGVRRIFSPADGQRLGLPAMINLTLQESDRDLAVTAPSLDALLAGDEAALARAISVLETGRGSDLAEGLRAAASRRAVPVLGITGTGGSGKSSLTDELIRRLRLDQEDKLRIAVIAVDPTRRRGGGALLGDRIRMNALGDTAPGGPVYFRSLATRTAGSEVPEHLADVIAATKAAGFDLVVVETPGIGQGDAAIVPFCDVSLYVMTPEYGAASQLEKIDMLDFADVVAVNKFERRGADDARRDVARQLVRNREAFGTPWEEMPVFGTSAARFNDDGVTALYQELKKLLGEHGLALGPGTLPTVTGRTSTALATVVPPKRVRYLAEVAETVRGYHARTEQQAEAARRRQHLTTAREALDAASAVLPEGTPAPAAAVAALRDEADAALDPDVRKQIEGWPALVAERSGDEMVYRVRDNEIRTPLTRTTLSGTKVPRVALPKIDDDGRLVRFLRRENLPGLFPFTAGVFPFKRTGEAPARMFAGEGDAFRTNRRFHFLSEGAAATRLSTAFDSVTLYGRDPATRPDIYGKVGTSGVSIATLDDMKVLYDGFDLCSPTTSVSMTINGPAPAILAMFLNTAIDQQLANFTAENGREPSADEAATIRARALATVRGTVQADILKEDQGQNTCIFSTEFALRCMADVQEWFIENSVRNFYSVSISGYHIAEAGANPISQLAFTLANGFTYVEAYLARGMKIDDFAPNLSFFFSNGMDAEYNVIGRVARRIWAVALREKYGAAERSQKLKYHVQTSGRSLHAQEMNFNDIRTTLQALCAIYDNCNSLHTNAFDEAVTTPTEQSVRRALAIQMIIDKEWGLAGNENPLQGSYIIEELTDLVEEAVLAEFERISERGGVLGAMETGYQRGRIQDESMLYEHRKHDGSLPIIGVNTFLAPHDSDDAATALELARATEAEKKSQLDRLADFHHRHRDEAQEALRRLRDAAAAGGNTFAELMAAVRVCSLGQITDAFFEIGGQYRRNV
ncbi:cobalamin-dependent protein [Frankia sp. CNm7]|uniref:Fused isobutyryl-CoA mutase n=1 Tax=Frankia nepalensis TaxID=1836974 RepID=A0A937RPB0_9ACTN|nr:fused isobutyryl-CoA mutase/GTPase IcmF [Frankia nepalensis]MBL7495203.1 cobalamin-dependent protein [Frankia nepalensis]MBL7515720.1 cobalamin-dependent protein [Frankia nepalensis]MBL7524932.1 cobalamin-dependent protein [Frankia nepalensis]MBL7632434.1 cobalamin-dependent protein [Frankia nepalensis]